MQTWGSRRLVHLFQSCSRRPLLPRSSPLQLSLLCRHKSSRRIKSRKTSIPEHILDIIISKNNPRQYGPATRDDTMTTSISIVSTPTADTPGTCLFLHNDSRCYVFGRPAEGTQRAFNSQKVAMVSTEHVFLSGSVSWDQVAGLFGYVLTVGGAFECQKEQTIQTNKDREKRGYKPYTVKQEHRIGVHGGENVSHTLAACRSVILRQPVLVSMHEHRTDPRASTIENLEPDWQDDAIRVWKIPVPRTRSSSPQKRRHSSPLVGNPEPQFKEASPLSNPEYAAAVVEKTMFNGNVGGAHFLTPVQLSDVKPTDTIFVREHGEVKLYKGPRPGDTGYNAQLDQEVWVIPSTDKTDYIANSIDLMRQPLPPTIYSQTSMCYIVKCHDRRGRFNPAKAKELGVPVTDFKILTAGKNVTGKDGITVTPDMVLGETQVGTGFVVADIQSRDFLDSFLERPEWSRTELWSGIVAVYWILGPGMVDDARIQQFVQDHPKVKHVFCTEDTCPNMIALPGPAELQTKLRRIDSDRFSLLKYNNSIKGSVPSGADVDPGRAGSKILLMPRLRLGDGTIAPFPNLAQAADSVSKKILDMARKAQEQISDPEFLRRIEEDEKDIPNRDAEIIPLGTGSSMPGKYRNVSATLIRVPGIGNYLLDCGEGTLGQIRRLFGYEEANNILRDLRCIVISHLHADHHLGTPNLIKAWYEHTLHDTNAKLAISCVSLYRNLLEEVSQVEDIGFHRLHFPNCSPELSDKQQTGRKMLEDNHFGLRSITRVAVRHCWLSFATEIELTSGLRIAYSGDCRPSDDFAEECKGAHLLVHECTFDNGMESHAKKKMHSTIGEALDIASKMKARRTLLTHFSQRYVKSDSLKQDDKIKSGEVLMAFDHMRVKLGDFKKAAVFQPAIEELLKDVGGG